MFESRSRESTLQMALLYLFNGRQHSLQLKVAHQLAARDGYIKIGAKQDSLAAHIKVIKGVKGEIYPCKPDIFEATYDSVEEPDE